MRNGQHGRRAGRIIAVGGGKGGAGKTFLSANLGLALAERGYRVVMMDADLGGANLHTVLGVNPPLLTLSDFIARRAGLDELAVATPFPNVRFISGALDDVHAANPAHQQKMRLLRHLGALDTDFLLLDLGAGTSFNILDFFLLADHGILVVRPEPTSVENAYRFLKAAFIRRLKSVGRVFAIRDLVEEARQHRNALGIHTPADLLRAILERDPDVGRQVQAQMAAFSPRLVVNEVRTGDGFDGGRVGEEMASACTRFFGIRLELLGSVPEDDAVRLSVRQRRPLYRAAPDSPARHAIDDIAARLLALDHRAVRAA